MTFSAAQQQHTSIPSNGGRLITTDGRSLPLRGTSVRVVARGGLARVRLEQHFVNPYDEPLRLSYLVPLPEDGAVSGYEFQLGERRIVGKVDRARAARERFEQALLEGRTAALLEEERGSLFSQELGNVPPRAEIVCSLTIDQRLVWLEEGAWEWRFPTVVSPRYLGEPGRTPDAANLVVDVADGAIAAQVALELTIGDAMTGMPSSPSHALATQDARAITLAAGAAALDRDLVVRWPVAGARVGISLSTCRPAAERASSTSAYGLLTVVPPTPETISRAVGRDLCLLLDTSGSMDGSPLAQAQRVAIALVSSLADGDRLEMIEFGSDARRWKKGLIEANAQTKADAIAWLRKLHASGGTDMTAGILEALATLRPEAQRQVVLITDGQIGFEAEVLREIVARLPATSRLHTVGVGSAVNRSLTRPAARAGAGLELIIGIDEDAERACARILRRTARPLLTELAVSGSAVLRVAPRRCGDLFAAAPGLVSVSLRPEGGELVVRARGASGPYEERIQVPALAAEEGNAAIAAVYARELVADLELAHAAGGAHEELDAQIEATGLAFQIATRLTSFVAVSEERTVDPSAPTRSETMPHALPHGVSAIGLGLRAAAPAMAMQMIRPRLVDAEEEVGGMMPPPPNARHAPASAGAPPIPGSPKRAAKASAPAPAKSPSIFQRVRRAMIGGAPKEARRRLRGKLIRLSDDRWVIEIHLDAPFELPVLDWVTGIDRAGRSVRYELDRSVSTRAGSLVAGQVARLVLTSPQPAELVAFALDESDDGPLVELEELR